MPNQLADKNRAITGPRHVVGDADAKRPDRRGVFNAAGRMPNVRLSDQLRTAASAVDDVTPSVRTTTRQRIGFRLLAFHRRSPIDGSAAAFTLRNGRALVIERKKQPTLLATIGRATTQGFL